MAGILKIVDNNSLLNAIGKWFAYYILLILLPFLVIAKAKADVQYFKLKWKGIDKECIDTIDLERQKENITLVTTVSLKVLEIYYIFIFSAFME